jgi:hypothetical protein
MTATNSMDAADSGLGGGDDKSSPIGLWQINLARVMCVVLGRGRPANAICFRGTGQQDRPVQLDE